MKRVLFVDDERSVLRALERMLRPQCDRWSMTFVQNAADALAHLACRRVDVVVTDMRMPGMNGAELLGLVRARRPKTIRIILSGEVDIDLEPEPDAGGATSAASTALAHMRLYKPCDAGVIMHALDGVIDAR